MEFNELSITLTKKLSKETKKKEGIYFTPKSVIKKVVDFILERKENPEILEPSCGSCQFVEYLQEKKQNKITCIEKNEIIYNSMKEKYNIICDDFLKHEFKNKFDVIVGNPPYFVMPKKDVEKSYLKYFTGRPNIYILFIIKCFDLLNEGGVLGFVLPTNFLNCIYYNELRKYLNEYLILDISISKDQFLETCQETCIFIIQKTKKQSDFFIKFDDIILFKPKEDIPKIIELKENSTTIHKLGCKLNVGKVVWNEVKNNLTDDSNYPLLIYNSDFKNNILDIQTYKDKLKKNYINKKGSTDTVLLVNRGYGTGKYNFNYCLIEKDNPLIKNGYLIENHCIIINGKMPTLKLIINSFENKKTKEFINLVFSNNAINIEEFLHILPIYK